MLSSNMHEVSFNAMASVPSRVRWCRWSPFKLGHHAPSLIFQALTGHFNLFFRCVSEVVRLHRYHGLLVRKAIVDVHDFTVAVLGIFFDLWVIKSLKEAGFALVGQAVAYAQGAVPLPAGYRLP